VGEHLTRGRPLASSPEMLQEAALELFVEQTYAKTTIEEITQRAGVSRATFFNYFPAKSDVFWVDLDDALRRLSGVLGEHQSVEKPLPSGFSWSSKASVPLRARWAKAVFPSLLRSMS